MDTDSTRQACTSLNKKIGQLSRERSKCTVYRVHEQLRNVNPTAYEPQTISIGPYHRGKDRLKMMEGYKLRYLQELVLESKGSYNAEKFAVIAGNMESEARKCYADQPSSLSASEFIEMLVLDGCFIIELVRRFATTKSDPMFEMKWIFYSLQRDLMLFENQVPFFVLCDLFDLIEAPHQHNKLLHLISGFYECQILVQNADARHEIKHILHFVHHSLLPAPRFRVCDSSTKTEENTLQFIKSASGLRKANVRFERKEEAKSYDIEFKDGVMLMAAVVIEDRTECFWRNLIAYEQYFENNQHNFVTEYTAFLDCLINSSKDVELLSRKGIIENLLGDDENVAKMVNGLHESVSITDGCNFHSYSEICENVNKHCSRNRNKWMAKLRRDYLHSPWAIISIVAAVVLLLLTIAQTVFTILQQVPG